MSCQVLASSHQAMQILAREKSWETRHDMDTRPPVCCTVIQHVSYCCAYVGWEVNPRRPTDWLK